MMSRVFGIVFGKNIFKTWQWITIGQRLFGFRNNLVLRGIKFYSDNSKDAMEVYSKLRNHVSTNVCLVCYFFENTYNNGNGEESNEFTNIEWNETFAIITEENYW